MNDRAYAAALAEARRLRCNTVTLPEDLGIDRAYRIQRLAVAAYGIPRTGYKIGATSEAARRLLDCEEPFYGPLLASDGDPVPAEIAWDQTMLGLECEFAFQMGRPFPGEPGDDEVTLEQAVACCVPAIEIVGRRLAGAGLPRGARCIADFGLNVGWWRGPEIPHWRSLDLATVPVTVCREQTIVAAGTGSDVLGHPLSALQWLADALVREGGRLEAGDWVSTGTCVGVVPVAPGTRVTARFGEDIAVLPVTLA